MFWLKKIVFGFRYLVFQGADCLRVPVKRMPDKRVLAGYLNADQVVVVLFPD